MTTPLDNLNPEQSDESVGTKSRLVGIAAGGRSYCNVADTTPQGQRNN